MAVQASLGVWGDPAKAVEQAPFESAQVLFLGARSLAIQEGAHALMVMNLPGPEGLGHVRDIEMLTDFLRLLTGPVALEARFVTLADGHRFRLRRPHRLPRAGCHTQEQPSRERGHGSQQLLVLSRVPSQLVASRRL